MNPDRFARALDRGRKRAERQTGQLAAVYERTIRDRAARAARALVSEAGLTAAAQPDWQPPPEGTLLADVGISVALRRQQERALETTIRPALERAGIAWNVEDPAIVDLLDQTAAWSGQAVTDAMLPELRRTVAKAFTDGLPVRDAAALIRAQFAETAPWQAEMLARSNLNMLGNGGMHVAVSRYNQAARANRERTVETKTWLTAGDSAVRPTHRSAAGQTVPAEQSFHVGGELLRFPGDPGGSLANCLNCRCTVIYGNRQTAAVASAAMGRTTETRRPAAARVAAATIPAVGWVSDLAFEGLATGDGRFFLPGAITWRELPIPLKAMTVDGPGGHEGSFVAGKITKIRRDHKRDMDGEPLPEGVTAIRAEGIFDMGGENGSEIARLVGDEFLRGVSVDPGSVHAVLRDPETGETWEPFEADASVIERVLRDELQTAFAEYQIAAATVCPTPAFAEARIALTASGERTFQIVAPFELQGDALTAAAAPVAPPRDWFFLDEPNAPTPLTIDDEGQVYGHIAAWGACHTGRQGECFQPPSSRSSYSYFNLGEIVCEGGERVPCGQITIGTDHAPLSSNWREAKAHYENTGRCIADVRARDGIHGIFVSGALRPHVDDATRREVCGAKPSGHWCQIDGALELIGVLEVNHPGYPVPRPQLALAASAAHPEGEPVALIAAGIVGDDGFDRRLEVFEARLDGDEAVAALIG